LNVSALIVSSLSHMPRTGPDKDRITAYAEVWVFADATLPAR
jgi:hypothetical protein